MNVEPAILLRTFKDYYMYFVRNVEFIFKGKFFRQLEDSQLRFLVKMLASFCSLIINLQ